MQDHESKRVRLALQTDKEPLKYMNSAKFVNSRLMRWTMFLQHYNPKVEVIKGSGNVGVDYLSRAVEWDRTWTTVDFVNIIKSTFRYKVEILQAVNSAFILD